MADSHNPRPHQNPDYSTLEVDARFQGPIPQPTSPEDLPEVYDERLPHVFAHKGEYGQGTVPAEQPYATEPAQPASKEARRICGMRKRIFWIVVIVALAVVIGAAVGGGVAAALRKPNKEDTQEETPPKTSPSRPLDILPNTRLATINFTDTYNNTNYLVFYQRNSKQLYQSAWNSSSLESKWKVSLVSADSRMEGTPISSNVYYLNPGKGNLHVYSIDSQGSLAGLTYGQFRSPTGPSDWVRMRSMGDYTVPSKSTLLSYGKENDDSSTQNIIVFQKEDNPLQLLELKDGGWRTNSPTNIDDGVPGSGMALVPIYAINGTKRRTGVFYNGAGSDSLRFVRLTQSNTWVDDEILESGKLNSSTVLAAFSSGYSSEGDVEPGSNDELTIHVLILEPGKAVRPVVYRRGAWVGGLGDIEAMADEKPLSIAANQDGRVYATVEGDDGALKIVEWKWTGGMNYEKVGDVGTSSEDG